MKTRSGSEDTRISSIETLRSLDGRRRPFSDPLNHQGHHFFQAIRTVEWESIGERRRRGTEGRSSGSSGRIRRRRKNEKRRERVRRERGREDKERTEESISIGLKV